MNSDKLKATQVPHPRNFKPAKGSKNLGNKSLQEGGGRMWSRWMELALKSKARTEILNQTSNGRLERLREKGVNNE